jgi:NAD-dependent deacetylase
MSKPKLAVFTGAGISAESGLSTFRASDGLWENHRIEDVASPEGWKRDMVKVLEFYNLRRIQASKALPNKAHLEIRKLEKLFDVAVITQNVDNLHEKAGSRRIIHLHGSLFQVRGTGKNREVINWNKDLLLPGDLAPDGSQLRPHIVWFGEAVPMMDAAIEEVSRADVLLIIGTSLQVYPAASLLEYIPSSRPVLYLDPHPASTFRRNIEVFPQKATEGIAEVTERLKVLFF